MEDNSNWVVWVASIAGVLAVIGLLFIIRWILQGRRYRGNERLDGKVAIITGSNTGLGKVHALDLAKRGARVYMACRDHKRCETARLEIVQLSGNQNVFNMTLDLGSLQSVRDFVKSFLAVEQQLHILVNNAGVLPFDRQTTVDGFEMQIGVNYLGPFLLTTLLLDVLRASAPSRIVVVSSQGHALGRIDRDDLQTEHKPYSRIMNYCNSKLAQVMMVRSLAQRLYGTGVTINALHPGAVLTEIRRDMRWINAVLWVFTFFYRTPEAGAQTQIQLSVDPKLEKVTGQYWENCREKRMGDRALDLDTAEWLWRTSETLTGSGKVV